MNFSNYILAKGFILKIILNSQKVEKGGINEAKKMIVEPIEIEPADITEEERALLSKTPKQLEENGMENMDQKS